MNHDTDSLDTDIVVVEGESSLPLRNEPLPPSVKLWHDYERDRIANPDTPRPYRPYLTPPPHQSPTPPQQPGDEGGK
jgi:hypothetical protein